MLTLNSTDSGSRSGQGISQFLGGLGIQVLGPNQSSRSVQVDHQRRQPSARYVELLTLQMLDQLTQLFLRQIVA
jgi:hypothetical protein